MSKYQTKIDPITGCEVLTTFGFFQCMADEKGTTPQKEMDDFVRDTEKMIEEDRALIIKDALEIIQGEWDAQNKAGEPYPFPRPEMLLGEVNLTKFTERIKESKIEFTVRVKAENKEFTIYYSRFYYGGDFYEPPSDEVEMGVEDE